MHLTKLRLKGINLDSFVNLLITEIEFEYENHGSDMTVLLRQEFGFLGSYYFTQILMAKEKDNAVWIDIFSDKSEISFRDFVSDTEEKFGKSIIKALEKHAVKLNFQIEKIKSGGIPGGVF